MMETSSFHNCLKNLNRVDSIQNNNHVYFSNAAQICLVLYRFLADPTVFSGHSSGIRHVIFFRGDTHLVTCADDRTLRVWDRTSGQVCTCYY
jgi:WD40 repeat protein